MVEARASGRCSAHPPPNMMMSRPVCWMLVSTLSALGAAPVLAQDRIYRCGNAYTNDPAQIRGRDCKPMAGGNITVIQGTRPQPVDTPSTASSRATTRPAAVWPSSAPLQRARTDEARAILEAELRKARERLAEARAAYADGQPEKQGIESRNYQRYLDRVAELKAAVERAEADVASLERELSRLPASSAPAAGPGARQRN